MEKTRRNVNVFYNIIIEVSDVCLKKEIYLGNSFIHVRDFSLTLLIVNVLM